MKCLINYNRNANFDVLLIKIYLITDVMSWMKNEIPVVKDLCTIVNRSK